MQIGFSNCNISLKILKPPFFPTFRQTPLCYFTVNDWKQKKSLSKPINNLFDFKFPFILIFSLSKSTLVSEWITCYCYVLLTGYLYFCYCGFSHSLLLVRVTVVDYKGKTFPIRSLPFLEVTESTLREYI